MFIDQAKITIKSGNGGNGCVSFRRELYVPAGGPDGGDGGNGGSIIFEVDKSLNTLQDFRHKLKYSAENGGDGRNKRMHGATGADLIIKVPEGTVIKETATGKIIEDLSFDNSKVVLLKGGRGGIGNMHFATSVMQAPKYAKPGEQGKILDVTLELKCIADVGLCGFPNAGKSLLINQVSNARPEVNSYQFTTLTPHLGVCEHKGKSFIICDIPGIIAGASEGVGLGLRFLRHIERTKLLLVMTDLSEKDGRNYLEDLKILFKELENYDKHILEKRIIIVGNKIDELFDDEIEEKMNAIKAKYPEYPAFAISGLAKTGLEDLLDKIIELLSSIKENSSYEKEVSIEDIFNVNDETWTINKIDDDYYEVAGPLIEKMLGYTNLEAEKGFNFFQKFLEENGIIEALKEKGMKEGATVDVDGYIFEYME